MTTAEGIADALAHLTGARHIVLHASMRRVGPVDGGADALAAALAARFDLVMMPCFAFGSNAKPPDGDRPARNGTDYTYYDGWSRPPQPFTVETAQVDAKMGVLARRFAARPDVRRSPHPWCSWGAHGDEAEALVRAHDWAIPNEPLERLARLAGGGAHVVLLGTGLTSCTALHVAEARAGRRPFIRWATDEAGRVRRMRVGGCAAGFRALAPRMGELLRAGRAGEADVLVAPLAALVDRAAALMRAEPELTRCSRTCVRCDDAIAGGPDDDA